MATSTMTFSDIKKELDAMLTVALISNKVYNKCLDDLIENIDEYTNPEEWESDPRMIADYLSFFVQFL